MQKVGVAEVDPFENSGSHQSCMRFTCFMQSGCKLSRFWIIAITRSSSFCLVNKVVHIRTCVWRWRGCYNFFGRAGRGLFGGGPGQGGYFEPEGIVLVLCVVAVVACGMYFPYG